MDKYKEPMQEPELNNNEIGAERKRFKKGWEEIGVPITARVEILDSGRSAIGLSAMQLRALGIKGNAIVKLEFNNKWCSAQVWNAFGPNAVAGEDGDGVRITESVSEQLGCSVGDDINITEIIVKASPINVDEFLERNEEEG